MVSKIKHSMGVLFLFDVKDSTKKVHSSNDVEQQIFYGLIKNGLQSVLSNIDYKIRIIKSTGDGYYIFIEDRPDIVLLFYVELLNAFSNLNYKGSFLEIRCGACYGRIGIIKKPSDIRGDLANVVARCCANAEINELVITETLYSLISTSTMISNLDILLTQLLDVNAKGCEDVKMWLVKKKLKKK